MKILVCGTARHGKDEFSGMLGLPFKPTTLAALDEFVWPLWGRHNYLNKIQCFNDRHNHRDIWYAMYCFYNKNDKARFAKKVLETSDVYCGMRCEHEVAACREIKLFDLILWVDASERVEYIEGKDSCTVTAEMCDVVINNNGTLEDLQGHVDAIGFSIKALNRGK